MSVNVAASQFASTTDAEENRRQAVNAVEAAANKGAQLVVLPENAMYSDPSKSKPDQPYSEYLDGPFASAMQEVAKRCKVAVVAGMTETVPSEERASNTLIHIDSNGERAGIYRKIHLYDAFGYQESAKVLPAAPTDPLLFELGGVTFGAMTCYDLRFPEMSRYLIDSGAEALIIPAAWAVGPMKELHWDTLLRARAIENTTYVIGVGQTGPFCTGQSTIIDPMGVTIASAGESPGNALAMLDPQRIESVRQKNPSITNRKFGTVPFPQPV